MTAAFLEDAHMETCLIAISSIGGSNLAFEGITETLDIDWPDKDFEGVALLNGGRVRKWTAQGDATITFEAYPLFAGTSSGSTGTGFFDLQNVVDTSVPIRVLNSRARTRYRVLIMWTNDTAATVAQTGTRADYSAMRIGMADGYFISVKPNFTDGILKYTCVFKAAAFDTSGNSCLLAESCAGATGSDVLPVIAAYTTSNKFG